MDQHNLPAGAHFDSEAPNELRMTIDLPSDRVAEAIDAVHRRLPFEIAGYRGVPSEVDLNGPLAGFAGDLPRPATVTF